MSTPVGPSDLVHVGWIMPPFIHELPVDAADADLAASRLKDIALEFLPDRSEEDQYLFALLLGNQLEPMTAAQVIYAGLCFLEKDGQPTASTITVSQMQHGEDEETLLPTIEQTLATRYRHDEVQQSELPCGPCVTRLGSAPFLFENPLTGETQRVDRTLIQVYVPIPGSSELMTFELSVHSPDGWDLHSELFAEILKTIDWTTDEEIDQQREIAGMRKYGDPGNVSVADDFG
jgi:hypothetical protein